MKQKTTLTALILLFATTGFALSINRLEPKMDKDITLGKWNYTLRVTARGSRSEGRTGRLRWNGRAIPPHFHELHNKMGKFSFVEGPHRWGDHGWMRQNKEPARQMGMTKTRASRSSLTRGWYRSKWRKIHTPKDWVRVRRDTAYYWVSPMRLMQLAQKKKWTRLHAHSRMLFKQ